MSYPQNSGARPADVLPDYLGKPVDGPFKAPLQRCYPTRTPVNPRAWDSLAMRSVIIRGTVTLTPSPHLEAVC